MQPKLPVLSIIETLRALLADPRFVARHRRSPEDFTRQRKLPFDRVVLFLIQKSLKSLQLRLHEFFDRLTGGSAALAATPGAWTQARAKP